MFHYKTKRLAKKGDTNKCPERNLNREDAWEQAGEDIDEHIALETRQCEYINPDNKHRCHRMTKKQLPFCWQHTMLISKLIVKPSKIGGLGLFACNPDAKNGVVFKKNDTVALYAKNAGKKSIGLKREGTFYTDKDLSDRYGCATAPYAVRIYSTHGGENVDTISQRSIGSYANGTLSEREANVDIFWNASTKKLSLVALKPIHDGDEILWYYGPDYQFKDPKPLEVVSYHTGRSERAVKCRSRRRVVQRRSSQRRRREQ